MKKSLIGSLMLALFCLQAQAESNQPANAMNASPSTNNAVTANPNPAQNPIPAANVQQQTPNTPAAPGTAAQPASQVIDCNYKIPAQTTTIPEALITQWSEKAATQSFDLDYSNIDNQLKSLQTCYTEQGWKGFFDALQKSGNVEAIKTQKLSVSSQVSGQVKILENKGNSWKIALPMQVVYQNDKEKLTQLLLVTLTVGRKINGDLGIMQLIAQPQTPSGGAGQPAAGAQKNS